MTQQTTGEIADDTDVDSDKSSEEGSEGEESQESTQSQAMTETRFGWHFNQEYKGFDAAKKFEEHFSKRNTRTATGDRTGLQCSINSVNSPAKAWRQIFMQFLLDKIVGDTNDCGLEKCKDWSPINRQDWIDFTSVLFIHKWDYLQCNYVT